MEAWIVGAVRTAIGRKNGTLSATRPDEVAAHTLKQVCERAGVDAKEVDDVIMGCVTQVGEQGLNIGRNAALLAGFPIEVTGVSVNRMCGSSQQAVNFATMGVMSGQQDLVIAAGTESMSRVPMGSDMFLGGEMKPPHPGLASRFEIVPQGTSAEMIAAKWKLTRSEVDSFSLESHKRAAAATDNGWYKKEIAPIEVTDATGSKVTFSVDEGIRRETSLEKLATLKTSFKSDGVVTAGNSSQISDGAAAVLIASPAKAKKLGLKPRARITHVATAGVDPTIMLTGPIPATQKVLAKAGLKMSDIDLFEVNEAFATVVLAWAKETGADLAKTNVNGGAVAMGHPLGASGARLVTTLLHEMERRDVKRGLVTMCIGFGQGTATIVERM